jgi:hypothetical protein
MTFDELAKLIEFDYEETRKDRDGTQWYRIKLWYKGRMFATAYFQGADLEAAGRKPTIDRVLDALQLECEWGRMSYIEYCQQTEVAPDDADAKVTWIRAMTIYNQLCDLFMGEFALFDHAEEEIA